MKVLSVSVRLRRSAIAMSIASIALLSACATPPPVPTIVAPPSFVSLMESAEVAQKQNEGARAMALYEQAAKADPASKLPWLRMAQAYFDSRSYGQAITASQEALHRDTTDVTAKSLMAVSGLRVSADALEQLRQANAVGGSTKSEAQALAKIMRDAVGEAVFPLPRPAVSPVAETAAPKPVIRRRTVPAAAPAATAPAATTLPPAAAAATPAPAVAAPAARPPAAAVPAPTAAKPSNPFDVLKKN